MLEGKTILKNKLFLIFLVILSLSQFSRINAQIVKPSDFNESYKVKIGDTANFRFSKIYNPKNLFSGGFILDNGSFVNFKISLNESIKVEVVDINKTEAGIEKLYSRQTVFESGIKKLSVVTSKNGYIRKAFNKLSDLYAYLDFEQRNITSDQLNSTFSSSVTGDFYSTSLNSVFGGSNLIFNTSYNWKTGWLNSSETIVKDTNNTIQADILLVNNNSLGPNNFYLIPIIDLYNLFLIGIILTPILLFSLVGVSYFQYNRKKQNTNFLTYFMEKLHYKHNSNKNKIFHPEKSLEIIEAIIEETTDQN